MEFKTDWPQITYLCLMFAGLLVMANKDGKLRTGRYSFWGVLIASIPYWVLLYFGGFFTK